MAKGYLFFLATTDWEKKGEFFIKIYFQYIEKSFTLFPVKGIMKAKCF